MKRLIMAMTAATALAAASPAAAQYYGTQYGYGYGQSNTAADFRIGMLQTRLNAGIRQGTINRREANSLQYQLSQLAALERRYAYNGLSARERSDLQLRIRDLRRQIRTADRGWYDRYERVDRYGNYMAPGYYGQGGLYEEVRVCRDRGGIAGVIEEVLGTDDDNCVLGVGMRATGNLYAVPFEYRNRYRDSYGVYYRSDGRAIYQIDARTGRVAAVFPM